VYRHFGEVDAAGTSPLYERVAVALSESGEALRAIEAARRAGATAVGLIDVGCSAGLNIGLAVFDGSALRAEAIGRCWSQGRMLAWLADS
jgi:hypothetical protein